MTWWRCTNRRAVGWRCSCARPSCPLGPEHFEWLAETRATARAVIADLRVAGFDGATVVLQWLPFGDVASIVSRWVRRWDGDQVRRTQLLAVVDSHLADQRFLDGQAYRAQPAGASAALQPVASGDPVALGESDAGVAGAPPGLADGRLNDLRELVRADGAVLACDRAAAASTTGAADPRVDRRARVERYDPGAGAGVHRPRARRRR